MIKREIKNAKKGLSASIKIKLNSLTSYAMVEELYKASKEGVKIKMIIRGMCCLIPENEKNIEVVSVFDRFLEHFPKICSESVFVIPPMTITPLPVGDVIIARSCNPNGRFGPEINVRFIFKKFY